MADSKRHWNRLAQGEAMVVTLQVAAEILPWADSAARAWLLRNDLVRHVDGRALCVWSDVVAAIRRGDNEVAKVRQNGPLARMKL